MKKTETIDMVDYANDLFEVLARATRPRLPIIGQRADLACPWCKSRSYVQVLNQAMCRCNYCDNHALIEHFEIEGEKWDNKETNNGY